MSHMTIEDLEEPARSTLRMRASLNGHSIEEEARDILLGALAVDTPPTVNVAAAIRRRVAHLGGVNIPLTLREPMRDPFF